MCFSKSSNFDPYWNTHLWKFKLSSQLYHYLCKSHSTQFNKMIIYQFDWTWGTLFMRNSGVYVEKEMLRKSTLLSLRSNENYSFNLDLVAYSATLTESMRRGYICSQSGFRRGCQARRNSLKYTWNPLKEVLGKPKNRSFVRSSNDGISIIPGAFWVLFVEGLL